MRQTPSLPAKHYPCRRTDVKVWDGWRVQDGFCEGGGRQRVGGAPRVGGRAGQAGRWIVGATSYGPLCGWCVSCDWLQGRHSVCGLRGACGHTTHSLAGSDLSCTPSLRGQTASKACPEQHALHRHSKRAEQPASLTSNNDPLQYTSTPIKSSLYCSACTHPYGYIVASCTAASRADAADCAPTHAHSVLNTPCCTLLCVCS